MPSLLSVESNGGVAVVTFQRPEKRNALSIELRQELADALDGLGSDESIGAVVLTGAGPAFCSGMDTTQFGGDAENRERLVDSSTAAFEAAAYCRRPLIAAVNGAAVAGGFALAMLCDLRVAAASAIFGFPELPAGIPPSYAAVRNAASHAVATQVALPGRIFGSAEALRLGLVGEVTEDDACLERAFELAKEIAAAPRWATIETKRRVLADRRSTIGELLADEGRVFRERMSAQPQTGQGDEPDRT